MVLYRSTWVLFIISVSPHFFPKVLHLSLAHNPPVHMFRSTLKKKHLCLSHTPLLSRLCSTNYRKMKLQAEIIQTSLSVVNGSDGHIQHVDGSMSA